MGILKNTIKAMAKRVLKKTPPSLRLRILRFLSEESSFSPKNDPVNGHMHPDTEWSLRNLKNNGFNPEKIIDGGAYLGNWTRMIKNIFPDSKVLMIEASSEKETHLQKVQSQYPETVDYAISLLGAENRPHMEFHNMESGSSVLEEQSNIPRDILVLPMTPLDEIASKKGFLDATFIKLDVQGYEIEVLKGSTKTLQRAAVILLEVSFLPYNQGAPLISEVVHFMNDHGFVIYDIGTLMRWYAGNTLLQGDLIFIREDSTLRPKFFHFDISKPNVV